MKINIYNMIILDESGSMCSIRQTAINGCNETIRTMRQAQLKYEESQQHDVTLITFNTSGIKTWYNRVPVGQVGELSEENYRPNAGTPLYDAMGTTLTKVRYSLDEAENYKVLVTIITDGEENSSVEYSGQMVKKLVDELKGLGWVFAYIGANQDIERVASSLSIENAMSFCSTEQGTQAMFERENSCRRHFYEQVEEERQGKGTLASNRYFCDRQDNE